MKSLAVSTIVFIVIGILVLGLLGYFFVVGTNPGEQQISRQQAVSKCQALCSEDQEKIYQLKGHPGVLDLPNQQGGVMYLKPSSFCSKKFNIKGEGKVFCDQLVTCRVTDGDGDVGYLHCEKSYTPSGGGGGGGGAGGGGGGGGAGQPNTINGPLAMGVPIGEKVLSCDQPGSYIKFYAETDKPLVGSKLKVWGVVCKDGGPVAGARVDFEWNNYPLSNTIYYMNFENLTDDNQHNIKYLKNWNFNQTYWAITHPNWFKDHVISAMITPGYLSVYEPILYMDTHKDLYYRSINFTNNYKGVDEIDAIISANHGPGGKNRWGNLSYFAGAIPEVTLILSNGTDEKYVHYYFGIGCMPGKYYNSYHDYYEFTITQENCSRMLTNGSGIVINNVTIPNNDTDNIYILKEPASNKLVRFDWKHIPNPSIPNLQNYTLKKVMFGMHVLGGTGGTGPAILFDNFKLIKYSNTTTTDKFGMFNITIDTPLKMGKYNLTATAEGMSSTGTLFVYPKPTINIHSKVYQNTTSIKISGTITYLNGTPINSSQVWIIIDGKPYSNKHIWINYSFDKESELNDWRVYPSTPAYSTEVNLVNKAMNVSTYSEWGTFNKIYYWFNPEQYVDNITFSIKPYIRSYPNYTMYIMLMTDDNGVERTYYYAIGKTGSKDTFGRNMWIWEQPRLYDFNATNNTWTTISFNPYNFTTIDTHGEIHHNQILKNENQRLVLLTIGEASGGINNRDDFLLDNVSIRTVGSIITDENGKFSLVLPKSQFSLGTHTLKIKAIGTKGEEAYITKTFSI